MAVDNTFDPGVFAEQYREVEVTGGVEGILETGRRFDIAAQVLGTQGVREIAVFASPSQAPAHLVGIRNSLSSIGYKANVRALVRPGSTTNDDVLASNGFTRQNGTVVNIDDGLPDADLALFSFSDGGQVQEAQRYLEMMKEGSVAGWLHGFYIGVLKAKGLSVAEVAPQLRGSVGICPKGMGPKVLENYLRGSGTNSSFIAHHGDRLPMTELALSWGTLIGSPYLFQTTFDSERVSDLTGERAVLLGLIGPLAEEVRSWKISRGANPEQATLEAVETIVGSLSKVLSKKGLVGVFEQMRTDEERQEFISAYNVAYRPLKYEIEKIYRSVKSGREVEEVAEDYETGTPKLQISAAPTWVDYEKLRASMTEEQREARAGIDPTVAGIYLAAMIAQVDVLLENGHPPSEIANESIIEATDSLNPIVRQRGFQNMVDGCSDTAQRGYRKWSGNFANIFRAYVLPQLDDTNFGFDTEKARGNRMMIPDGVDYFAQFLNHSIHKDWATFAAFNVK